MRGVALEVAPLLARRDRAVGVLVVRVHRHHRPVVRDVAGKRQLRAARGVAPLLLVVRRVGDLRGRVLLLDAVCGRGEPQALEGLDPHASLDLRRVPWLRQRISVRALHAQHRRARLRDVAEEDEPVERLDGDSAARRHAVSVLSRRPSGVVQVDVVVPHPAEEREPAPGHRVLQRHAVARGGRGEDGAVAVARVELGEEAVFEAEVEFGVVYRPSVCAVGAQERLRLRESGGHVLLSGAPEPGVVVVQKLGTASGVRLARLLVHGRKLKRASELEKPVLRHLPVDPGVDEHSLVVLAVPGKARRLVPAISSAGASAPHWDADVARRVRILEHRLESERDVVVRLEQEARRYGERLASARALLRPLVDVRGLVVVRGTDDAHRGLPVKHRLVGVGHSALAEGVLSDRGVRLEVHLVAPEMRSLEVHVDRPARAVGVGGRA